MTNGIIFYIFQHHPFQVYFLRQEIQIDKLPQNDGEKDVRVQKKRRKKCGEIEIHSDELVFSRSDKFLIREESDCIRSLLKLIATENLKAR